jgi:hypothetical protein
MRLRQRVAKPVLLREAKIRLGMPGPTLEDRPNEPPHGRLSDLNLSSREAVQIMRLSLARAPLQKRTIGLNQGKMAAKGKSGVSGG